MASIRNLKEPNGDVFFPLTHERAVRDSAGVNLETKLGELNSRPYNSQSPNGMGYLVLDKDKTFASQVISTNTIYEIRYDFALAGNFTMPAGCTLRFNGGSLSGAYALTGSNTKIDAEITKIFGTDVALAGTWDVSTMFPEWFGAVGDGTTDDSTAISKCVQTSYNVHIPNVKFLKKSYRVSGDNPCGLEKVSDPEPPLLYSEERSLNVDFNLAHLYWYPSNEDDCFAFVGYLRHSVWENLVLNVIQANASNLYGDVFSTHFGISGALHRFSQNTFRNMAVASSHTFRRFFSSDCSGGEEQHHDDLSIFEKIGCKGCLTMYYTNNGNSVSNTFEDCSFSLNRDNAKVFWVNTTSWAGSNRFVNNHFTIIDCDSAVLFKLECENQGYATVYVDKSRCEIRNSASNWMYFDIANGVIHFGDFFNINQDSYNSAKIYGIVKNGKVDFSDSLGVYTPIQLIGVAQGYDTPEYALRFTRCSFVSGAFAGSKTPLISYKGGNTVYTNRYTALSSNYAFGNVIVERPFSVGDINTLSFDYILINSRKAANEQKELQYRISTKTISLYKCTAEVYIFPADVVLTKLAFLGDYNYFNQGVVELDLILTKPDGTQDTIVKSGAPTSGVESDFVTTPIYIKAGTSFRVALMKSGGVEYSDGTSGNTYLIAEMHTPVSMEELKEIYDPS